MNAVETAERILSFMAPHERGQLEFFDAEGLGMDAALILVDMHSMHVPIGLPFAKVAAELVLLERCARPIPAQSGVFDILDDYMTAKPNWRVGMNSIDNCLAALQSGDI